MLSSEFLQLLKERKLLIAIIAVITVPILYAGMFLWAFWDPYDQLDELPIAVVNEDVGVYEEGEWIHLGDELVKRLDEERDFDFHFVSKQEAYAGLENEDYYVLIEIPDHFSENALTVLDEQPKKAELIYVPNESYNFLASQIGETAMLQIKVALQEKITETYAETIFDKITEVADGLVDASDATIELNDGAVKLSDGTNKINDSLLTLAEKSLQFTDGVSTIFDGTASLVDGTNSLKDGLGQLDDASDKLLSATKEINKGNTDLLSGITDVNKGTEQLNENIPLLIEGTEEVRKGISLMQEQLPSEIARQMKEQITSSIGLMNEGLTELEEGIVNGLQTDLANGLTDGLVNRMIEIQAAQTESLSNSLIQSGVDQNIVQQIVNNLKQSAPSKEQLTNQLKPQIDGAIHATVDNIEKGFNEYKHAVDEKTSVAVDGIKPNLELAINPLFDQLLFGITSIYDGQNDLKSGIDQLANGTTALHNGAETLVTAQTQYANSLEQFSEKMTDASIGASELSSGSGDLLEGMEKLLDSSSLLTDGTEQIAEGSIELNDGMIDLVEGTEQFASEMNDASDKVNDISTNEATYKMIASPVQVNNEKINEVPNYGTGFAPYFLSLGLFVGALLLSIVFPLREPAGIPKNAFQWFYSKFSVMFAVGVLQALIASGFLLLVLKLEVQNIPLFLLFAIITSLVFVTIIQFLVTCLDDPGRFIAILLLIMQLTTSAGTFPLELIPNALQPLNKILPMTYSVSGFKAVISSGNYGVMGQNAVILLLFAVISMLLTYSYFAVMFKRKFGLHQNKKVAV